MSLSNLKKYGDLGGKAWGNVVYNEEMADRAAETPKKRAARVAHEKRVLEEQKRYQAELEREVLDRRRKMAEAQQRVLNEEDRHGPNTTDVRRMRSSFKRYYKRNPTSFIRSRRRKLGRPSKTPRSSKSSSPETRRSRPHRHFGNHNRVQTRKGAAATVAATATANVASERKPRPGKFMKECRADCTSEGCARQKATGDCKFVHKGEPEYAMLRDDQKVKKGGFAISSPAPLSQVNTYTSWPGGVDPTVRLYNQASML
jgi:hypothetical protein